MITKFRTRSPRRRSDIEHRKRRLATAATVAAAVVGITGSACTPQIAPAQAAGGTTPAATTPTTTQSTADPTATAPGDGGSPVVSIRLQDLERRGEPTVDTVRDHVWHQVGGDAVYLGDEEHDTEDYRGTFLPVDAGLFAATRTGPDPGLGATVHAPDGEIVTTIGGEVGNVVPGPKASVLWIGNPDSQDDTLVIGRYTTDGAIQTFEVPLENGPAHQAAIVAARDSVFVQDDGEVTRYELSGGELSAPERVEHDGRRLQVLTADPQTNTVAFRSVGAGGGNRSCSYVVDADELTRSWQTCDYQITAISPDGQYVFGYSGTRDGGLGAVFNAGGDVVLELDGVFGGATFDDQNRLNLIGVGRFNDVGPQIAMVVCEFDRTCRRASDIYRYPLEQGTIPLAAVGHSSP